MPETDRPMDRYYDYLVVGAGFSGLTVAERMATLHGKTSLIIDRRGHIGGNAHDRYDDHGVLIHAYGPHYFRTNSARIRDYLSQFTSWHPVAYEIRSWTDGRYWHFPINLNTFEQIVGRPSTTEEMEAWLAERRVPIQQPRNSEEVIISQVGWELYEKFFKGYTMKQWKRHPRELDASVCGRIPLRTNRDNRYLNEEFQALPAEGYTRMFQRMLAACGDKATLLLNTSYRDILPQARFRHLIFTGPIDEFFDFRHGRLPYRSLRFENESFAPEQLRAREPIAGKPGYWQPFMQVNYPNDGEFTRIVEIKHATGQQCDHTTIIREYPEEHLPGREPYYPVPAPDAMALYRKYREDAATIAEIPRASGDIPLPPGSGCRGISFIGRLGTYRYYNMDQVVGMALTECDRLAKSAQTR